MWYNSIGNLLMFYIYNMKLFSRSRWGFITGPVLDRLCLNYPMMYKDFKKHLWSQYSNLSDTSSMMLSLLRLLKSYLVQPIQCCARWAMQHVQTNSAHICGRLFVINLCGLPWLLNGIETFKQSTYVGIFLMKLFSSSRWGFITGPVLDGLFSNCPMMYKDFKKHSHTNYSNMSYTSPMI
jgi:hypothetical protein